MEQRPSIEEVAKACHEANKVHCESIGDFSQPHWENAPEWQKSSAIAGVEAHVASGFTMTPADSHASWLKQKESEGWVYGEVKDVNAKTHPCMVPYEQLPETQKAKDSVFVNTVHSMLNSPKFTAL